jgi:hypothetical protein
MVLDQYRVSWEAVIPNDVSKLVQTLLSNGYEKITVEKVADRFNQTVDDHTLNLSGRS